MLEIIVKMGHARLVREQLDHAKGRFGISYHEKNGRFRNRFLIACDRAEQWDMGQDCPVIEHLREELASHIHKELSWRNT